MVHLTGRLTNALSQPQDASESLDFAEILKAYDREQRRDVLCFDTDREATSRVVRHVSRLGGQGAVLYWELAGANIEAAVREQIRYFEGIGQDFEWKVHEHDSPADIGAQLVALGFKAEEEETLVVLALNALPERLAAAATESVQRIIDPGSIDEIKSMMEEVWHEDFTDLATSLRLELNENAAHLGLYIARAGGVLASVGWLRFAERGSFASLWGGTTLPKYRNRGLYTALVAVRARDALRRGFRYLTVDAAPTSRPILEKLGFQALTRVRGYTWSAKRQKVGRSP
jgi:GNAT superfamily N-acetyltransferase